MKVFLITSGSYSDYSVDSIFSTREAAETELLGCNSDSDIEEWDVLDAPSELSQKIADARARGLKRWYVGVDLSGNVTECEGYDVSGNLDCDQSDRWELVETLSPMRVNVGGVVWGAGKREKKLVGLSVVCIAEDDVRAIKIAAEKFAEWKQRKVQEGEWPTP